MSKMVSNSSGYKGVHKAEFGFQVEAKVDGKRHYVGYSTDAKEAARMYDKFVSKYDDPFLVTNEQLGLL